MLIGAKMMGMQCPVEARQNSESIIILNVRKPSCTFWESCPTPFYPQTDTTLTPTTTSHGGAARYAHSGIAASVYLGLF